jgi:hypothetical protein
MKKVNISWLYSLKEGQNYEKIVCRHSLCQNMARLANHFFRLISAFTGERHRGVQVSVYYFFKSFVFRF